MHYNEGMDIRIEPSKLRRVELPQNPKMFGFGKHTTERLFVQKYSSEQGWHDAAIIALSSFPKLSPMASVFHYGQEIFEGHKAYRRPDGDINLFRAKDNAKRLNRSAQRMAMPGIPVEDQLEAVQTLIDEERAWVPAYEGTSLYLRPTMIATDEALGVHPSETYLYYIVLSLAGNYFPQGFKPIAVKVETENRRAVVGGTGEAKTGGNYAASLAAASRAQKEGFSQVLWLDAREGKWIEEVGAMNICFVYGDHIITPSLSGSILPGITRDSLLKLAPDLGFSMQEKKIDIATVIADIKSGRITEVFGCGTAAVIAPIDQLGYEGKIYQVRSNRPDSVAAKLKRELTAIQYGEVPDLYGWTKVIR